MKGIFNPYLIFSNEGIFWTMVAAGGIMVLLTIIFVAKEIKKNANQ